MFIYLGAQLLLGPETHEEIKITNDRKYIVARQGGKGLHTEGRTHNLYIHERCNECNCQRGHTPSIGCKEDTRLDTQAHSLHKSTQAKRIIQTKIMFYNSKQDVYIESMIGCTCAKA